MPLNRDVLQLRPATVDDAAEVARVLYESRAAFLPYALVHSRDEYLGWVTHALLPSGGVTVAIAGGSVAGVLAVEASEGRSWITQLYVAPESTGRGVGSHLLRDALARLPRPVRLQTFQQNEGARRFYERHGFVVIATGDGSANEEHCPDVTYELR